MNKLDKLREEINLVDKEILVALRKRMELVKEIGAYKKQHNLPIRDPQREEQILEAIKARGVGFNLSASLLEKVWRTFFEEAYKIEKQ